MPSLQRKNSTISLHQTTRQDSPAQHQRNSGIKFGGAVEAPAGFGSTGGLARLERNLTQGNLRQEKITLGTRLHEMTTNLVGVTESFLPERDRLLK